AALRFQLGVILLDLQRDVPAMDVFQRLTEDFPELPEPFNNIALLHARAGQLEQARQALEMALRNNPALVAARQNLGDIHLRLALQAWEAVALALPADAALQRKLKLSRELLAAPLR
ncbi:MAG: tetratricopeptide repeat protein, partial [Rubrivivax sp.]